MSEDGRRKLREYGIAPPQAASSRRALFGEQEVACPQCGSGNTELLSEFGSTSCKALWRCKACREPFRLLQVSLTMSAAAPRFHRLAVNDLRRETAGRGVADLCDSRTSLPTTTLSRPGQYLTLRTTMDGEEVRRSYSICSGPDDGELRIAVKKVDGGAFSSWAADESESRRRARRDDADRPLWRRAMRRIRRGSMSALPPAPASRRSCRSSRACWRASRTAASSCSTATAPPTA